MLGKPAVILFFVFLPLSAFGATEIDTDHDGLTDKQEKIFYTNSTNPDTDGDGFFDGAEIYEGFSPWNTEKIKLGALDSDNDGTPDSWEIRLGLDLRKADTDGDGFSDGEEIKAGFDPRSVEAKKIEKKITVSLKNQELTYFFDGIELERFKISSGVASMPTPKGTFNVLDKVPTKQYGGTGYNFYYPNTKWNLHFTTRRLRYYIHGAYWHNNFGKPMSHGCVNVSYANMERLYTFAEVGTAIEIN